MLLFLKASSRNLIKATAVCAAIFFVILLIIAVAISASNNDWSEFRSLKDIMLIPLFSIGLSCMIMVIAFFSEYNEFKIQQTIFGKAPFSQLPTIGFEKIQLFTSSFWKLYKEVYAHKINDYLVIADFESKKAVSFVLLTAVTPSLRLPVPEQYREVEIYSKPAGLVVKVPVDTYSTPGIDALHKLLTDASFILKGYAFAPTSSLGRYEKMLKSEMIAKGLTPG